MKFGICTGFEKVDGAIAIPHLEFIKTCGFDYVELALNAVVNLSDEDFFGLKAYLKDNSIPCLVCNCFMDSKIKMTGSEFDPAVFEDYVDTAVCRAAELGCRKLVLGSGGSRNVPSEFPMEEAERQFNLCLDIIIQKVTEKDIQLELEHLNRLESNIVTSFRESTGIVKAKNSPNFKSIIDYFHFALGNEEIGLIEEENEQIGHIHFARPLGRTYPCVDDLKDLQIFFDAIKNTGYNDTFSMECSFPDMEKEPPEYALVLKKIKDEFSSDMVKSVERLRLEKGYNCSQCIVCAYAHKLGITEEQAFKLSEALGGGVAGTGGICGAVSGMAIVAGGLVSSGNTDGKQNTYKTVKELIDEFNQKNGSIYCTELKGTLTGKPLRSCMDCIKDAAEIIENSL